jgi:hypothetical protein
MRRIPSASQVVVGFVATALAAVVAATTTTVVDVPVEGGTQRFLYVRPDAPVATMVYLPGGDGLLGIDSLGSMPPNVETCDPVVRNSNAFAAHGIALALVDGTSNGRVRQYADVHEVIRYVRSRDSVSTWMMGISAGTSAAVDLTVDSPAAEVQGVVFLSPFGSQLRAGLIKVPTLLVYHGSDQFAGPFVDPLFDGLIAAPAKERVVFGGGEGGGCGLPYHLFFGFDAEMVTAVADFVLKYSPSPTGKVPAIEYYYDAWDMYFVTAIPDEIAALDAGAFGGVWKRTGEMFSVWPEPTNGALPACRFFSVIFAPKSSHFYTPYVSECASLKAGTAWQYEGIAFYVLPPDANGNCPVGTVVLYRLYNDGMGGAPNHRFTTSVTTFNQMRARGWPFEGDGRTGAYACVPQ